jgi:YHS domain-containing protein
MPVINHKKMEVCSGVKRNFDLIPQQYFRKQVNKRGSLSKRLNAIIKKAKIKISFDCKTRYWSARFCSQKISADLKEYAEKQTNFDYVVQDLIPL